MFSEFSICCSAKERIMVKSPTVQLTNANSPTYKIE